MAAGLYRIDWRPMAQESLRDIVRFIARDSPARAKAFGKQLRAKARPLARNLRLGSTGRPGTPDWLRELVVHPNYILFYRVLEETRSVQILRIKHAAQLE